MALWRGVVGVLRIRAMMSAAAVEEGLPGSPRNFIPHENPQLFQLLPLAVQGQKGADLEEACGDIERNRQVGPLFQVVPDLPILVAVIDDKELAP